MNAFDGSDSDPGWMQGLANRPGIQWGDTGSGRRGPNDLAHPSLSSQPSGAIIKRYGLFDRLSRPVWEGGANPPSSSSPPRRQAASPQRQWVSRRVAASCILTPKGGPRPFPATSRAPTTTSTSSRADWQPDTALMLGESATRQCSGH